MTRPLIETRSIDYIPLAERHGKAWHLWPVWFTSGTQLATVATGAIGAATGGNFLWSAVAILTGCAVGTFFMAFHSAQGPQLGLPQMIQSRPQFGYMGALLVWIVALISYVGYNAFNQLLAGQTAHQLCGIAPGPAAFLFTALSLGLSVVGYDLIHRAQRWLAWLLIATLALFSLGVLLHPTLVPAQVAIGDFRTVPFATQFFAAAAYQLSGAFYVSDYSRYLPRDTGVRATFWWTYMGAFTGSFWTMLVGAYATATQPGLDIASAVEAAGDAAWPGCGPALLLAALLGLLTMNGLNYYGASLTLLSVVDSFRPVRATAGKRLLSLALVAVAASLIALLATGDFVRRFGDLLAVLLYLFTPWTAINLVDFYIVRQTRYSIREIFNPHGIYGRWSWRGLVAYGGGFIAMIPFFSTGLYSGPAARALGGADIAMLIGLPVSTAIYLLACRSLDTAAEFRRVALADRDIEPAIERTTSAGTPRIVSVPEPRRT